MGAAGCSESGGFLAKAWQSMKSFGDARWAQSAQALKSQHLSLYAYWKSAEAKAHAKMACAAKNLMIGGLSPSKTVSVLVKKHLHVLFRLLLLFVKKGQRPFDFKSSCFVYNCVFLNKSSCNVLFNCYFSSIILFKHYLLFFILDLCLSVLKSLSKIVLTIILMFKQLLF